MFTKGFLLDDDKHNGLLDDESIRKLIIGDVMVEQQFEGVRLFLDSMLKDIVDSDHWQKIHLHKDLPLPRRLQRFIRDMFPKAPRYVNDGTKSTPVEPIVFQKSGDYLLVAMKQKNVKTFRFLCDCLDATLERSEIRFLCSNRFIQDHIRDIFKESSYDVFQRLVDLYDDVDDEDFYVEEFLVKSACRNSPPYGLEYSHWNQKSVIQMADLLLDFMGKHYKT